MTGFVRGSAHVSGSTQCCCLFFSFTPGADDRKKKTTAFQLDHFGTPWITETPLGRVAGYCSLAPATGVPQKQ